MIICAYTFSILATKYEKVNGVVDYAEAAVGEKYAFSVGWFLTTVYYPTLTMALAWLSARYTLVVIFGSEADISGGLCLALSSFYLIGSYALNTISPILAGKFQVSSTFIKLVPLLLMGIAGTIYGLTKGHTVENFTTVVTDIPTGTAIFKAVCATAFAYEGWIIATSINAELKDSKKNLPKALVLGSFIIVAIYVLYYIGLSGAIPNEEMMSGRRKECLCRRIRKSRRNGNFRFCHCIMSRNAQRTYARLFKRALLNRKQRQRTLAESVQPD